MADGETKASLPRVEDYRFITGDGLYSDDIRNPLAVHAVFVRSPYAHATIENIELEDARSAPGVIDVLTFTNLIEDSIGDVPCIYTSTGKGGMETVVPRAPLLAGNRTVYVGEPVALVIAETVNMAREAAELVMIDYEPLIPVDATARALLPGTTQIWPEAPDNLALDWEIGDAEAVEKSFKEAAYRVSLTVINSRVAVSPLEPRAAIASYDAQSDCLTLTTPSQGVYGIRAQLAEHVFKLPPEKFHVITPDVGGGFGARFYCNREQLSTAWAARRTGRTVRWTADRNECFTIDGHGRDHINSGELALDASGRFLALKVSSIANMGAYMVGWGTSIPTDISCEVLTGTYSIPAAHANVKCVFTNMVQIDAYRGTGRAETIYLLERLVDAGARELGIAPDELRRRNFIRPEQLPYQTPVGQTYDSGDFLESMEAALIYADWAGAAQRKKRALAEGKLVGIGIASYVMSAAGIFDEQARMQLNDDGSVSAFVGTQSTGQGHATAYTQLIAERFGIPVKQIQIVQGDTRSCPPGAGTGQSRSLLMGGLAVQGAADALLNKLRSLVGQLFQADATDLSFADGMFRIPGTDRQITLYEIAQTHADLAGGSEPRSDGARPLEVSYTAIEVPMTFPQGCHICELAVDRDTGSVEIHNYTSVDDFGILLNPMLCEGQLHGGTVQGIGQALMEHVVHEEESGQLLTGSFMDYRVPRAGDLPMLNTILTEIAPCLTNAMGVKGSGEAGTIAAPPAVINAVIDALSPLGITHIDMPATPQKVWQAIKKSSGF